MHKKSFKFRIAINFVNLLITIIFSQHGLAVQYNQYSKFRVEELSKGEDVTVGKYVMAFMKANDSAMIVSTEKLQNIEIKLEWKSQKNHKNIYITGDWLEKKQAISLGASLKKNRLLKNKRKPEKLIIVKGQKPNTISFTLQKDKPITLLPLKNKFGKLLNKVNIIIASDHAFTIKK